MRIILNDTLKKQNKSQYQLAKDTGIAASTLNNLCNNKTTSILFSNLDKICEVLKCTPNDVLQPDYLKEKDGTE